MRIHWSLMHNQTWSICSACIQIVLFLLSFRVHLHFLILSCIQTVPHILCSCMGKSGKRQCRQQGFGFVSWSCGTGILFLLWALGCAVGRAELERSACGMFSKERGRQCLPTKYGWENNQQYENKTKQILCNTRSNSVDSKHSVL